MISGDIAKPAGRNTSMLFVCMGNICRSPTSEGVFRKLQQELAPQLTVHIASAGTHAYHVGEPPDERAVLAARARGIDISAHRGRVVAHEDFDSFDYMLAMDHANLRRLQSLQPSTARAEVRLLLEFAENGTREEVPDPYYGGPNGFEQVLDLIEQGCIGLLRHVCGMQGIQLSPTGDRRMKKPARF